MTLWPLIVASEFYPWQLLAPSSLEAAGAFLATFVPPANSPDFLELVVEATWQTIAIATAGLLLGWIVAVPLTIVSTARLSQSAIGRPMGRMSLLFRQAVRWLLVFLRSVPELVWALLFVRIVGLGPTGVLAIALTYAGMLGKVYGEILESADPAPTDALLRNGASRLQALAYGTLPQAAPELASYTIFRWECAIRSSVIMGFVGGGGLGQQMDLSMKMLAGGEVATMLIVFMLLVGAADLASRLLRNAMDDPGVQARPSRTVGATSGAPAHRERVPLRRDRHRAASGAAAAARLRRACRGELRLARPRARVLSRTRRAREDERIHRGVFSTAGLACIPAATDASSARDDRDVVAGYADRGGAGPCARNSRRASHRCAHRAGEQCRRGACGWRDACRCKAAAEHRPLDSRTGLGGALADRSRARPTRRHAGARRAHDRRTGAPVRRNDGEPPAGTGARAR